MKITKDNDGNKYMSCKNDPRFLNKELVGVTSNYFKNLK